MNRQELLTYELRAISDSSVVVRLVLHRDNNVASIVSGQLEISKNDLGQTVYSVVPSDVFVLPISFLVCNIVKIDYAMDANNRPLILIHVKGE